MAHYAFLDDNNVVTDVIVGRHEYEAVDGVTDWEAYYAALRGQRCVRTSYNGNIRRNFAGVGYTYDEARDAFIPPKLTDDSVFNEETCVWEVQSVASPDFVED